MPPSPISGKAKLRVQNGKSNKIIVQTKIDNPKTIVSYAFL